jgi:predicted N-acyltransferase
MIYVKGQVMARTKRQSIHYVNNADFSAAVVEYVKEVRKAKAKNEQLPIVTDYIASCFLKIAEGLSHKSNFIRYTYREEMVMDAVENCLKAIENYNLETATRTGKPNAFAYFTQITWYAFLRRIAKEKKQQDIKLKYLTSSGLETFVEVEGDTLANTVAQQFVDFLKDRIDKVKATDDAVKEFVKKEKRKKREMKADSDLSEFLK